MSAPLPVKNGVNPSTTFLPKGPWQTVLDYLCEKFPGIHKNIWIARMEKGEVVTLEGENLLPDSRYRPEQRIFYYRELDTEKEIPFEAKVIFENENILVVDKPHFLPVTPSGEYLQQSLLVRLRNQFNEPELSPAHRLDRLTAGVILFTRKKNLRHPYQNLFASRAVQKYYLAISSEAPVWKSETPLDFKARMVEGEQFYVMKIMDGEPNSRTEISYLGKNNQGYLYGLKPESGKKHQLRVHMSTLGMPILNDNLYPEIKPYQNQDFSQPLKLLAKSLSFIDPITSEQMFFESEQQLI